MDERRSSKHRAALRDLRGLYAIVDVEACGERPVLEVADAILSGGCALLQLRAKQLCDLELLELARALSTRCQKAGVPFVLNDRPELCEAAGAQGVHVGQGDASIELARAQAKHAFVGVSTHSLEQAQAADEAGADLVALGPLFPTRSKRDPDPVVGLALLEQVARELRAPVVAIGGITLDRAAEVAASGAALGAVISAICAAPDPEAAARALHVQLGGRARQGKSQ
jgi:thiamine-phosphate pyrophosphorylase